MVVDKRTRKRSERRADPPKEVDADVEDMKNVKVVSELEMSAKKRNIKAKSPNKKKKIDNKKGIDSNNDEETCVIEEDENGIENESKSDDETEPTEKKVKNTKTKQNSKKKKAIKPEPVVEENEDSNTIEEDSDASENEESKSEEHNESQSSNSSTTKKMKNPQNSKKDRNSVIVGNLPYGATNNMLQELLQTVLCKEEIKNCNIATYPDGNTKGFGYLEFSSKEAVQKALQLNGSKMGNRTLLFAINDKRIDKIYTEVKNTLYIGITKDATDGQVIEFLGKVIPINEIVRFERSKTARGEPVGYLILEVASEEAYDQIKKLDGVVLECQAISVKQYRTSVMMPNFITTKRPKPQKQERKSNIQNNFHDERRGQFKFSKKRSFNESSNENNKQHKPKKNKSEEKHDHGN